MSALFESVQVDYPFIACVDRVAESAVATASADVDFLFHNRANLHLLCLHSQQQLVDGLPVGETAAFRQYIYFVAGGVEVAAYERLPPE